MTEFQFYLIVLFCYTTYSVGCTMLHPNSSIISIISSVSIPLQDLHSEYRTLIDWCFQMSYDLPSKLTTLYNTPIWTGKLHRVKRNYIFSNNEQQMMLKALKYSNSTIHMQSQHIYDFSAGELYQVLEDFLMSLGFHETCLIQAICELAHHPFADQQSNILTTILTFILSPSLHKGFNEHEHLYRDLYEAAELYGFLNEDCQKIYGDCRYSLLKPLTRIVMN